MKRLFFILLISIQLGSFNSYSQKIDHLAPVSSIFDTEYKYYSLVREILFDELSVFHILQFIEIPSFGPESILTVEIDTVNLKNPTYSIVYHRSKKNIWYNIQNKKEKVGVDKYKKTISAESVELLKKLFDSALMQTRYPGNSGFDGVRYIFTYSGKAGMYWSTGVSSNENKIEKLITICNKIKDQLENENEYFEFDKVLITEIESLIEELN